jgi:hypothetical protein
VVCATYMALLYTHYAGTQENASRSKIARVSARRRRTRRASRRVGSEDASHEALSALARMDSYVLPPVVVERRAVYDSNRMREAFLTQF